jgi:predicted negative regulator of RcsB-dependent stress response
MGLRSEVAALRAENVDWELRHREVEKLADDLAPIAATVTPRRMAALAVEAGNYDEAEQLLVQEVARAPDDAALHLQLGRLHYARNAGAAAEAELSRAMALDPRNHLAPLLLGQVQARRGLKGQARAAFREALRRNPDCVEARDGLLLLKARTAFHGAIVAAAAAVALAAVLLLRLR